MIIKSDCSIFLPNKINEVKEEIKENKNMYRKKHSWIKTRRAKI